jgi:hypothetical protein
MRNINLPKARVYVRCDAFGGSDEDYEPAWLVSVRAMRNRPLCFQVWVDRFAACYDKVAPHCLYWYEPEGDELVLPLHKVQMWECLSGSIELWQKAQLADVPVLVNLGKGSSPMGGHYWFTLDYLPEGQHLGMLDVGDAELLEEHKEGNVIKLSNGQVAIYPNNRIKWLPVSLTPKDAIGAIPDWDAASNGQWDEWWSDSDEILGDSKWAY